MLTKKQNDKKDIRSLFARCCCNRQTLYCDSQSVSLRFTSFY